MRLIGLLVSVAAAIALGAPSRGAPAPGGSLLARSPAAKKRCRTVVKKVKGKKKRVRVCKKARPKPKPKPAGFFKRVDVGGYRLAIQCVGTGSPTVVLDSGLGAEMDAFFTVQPNAARTTRVCTYDRAGLGASDRRPGGPATTVQIVDELHTLLGRAGLTGPYVLGGWSIGGLDVRFYAHRYPAEVAGLVTIDGVPESLILASSTDLVEGGNEAMLVHAAATELAADGDLGARPLVVLVAGPWDFSDPQEYAAWVAAQKGVAGRSSNVIFARADDSGHAIPFHEPGLVVQAIRLVALAVRTGAPLAACAQTPLPAND